MENEINHLNSDDQGYPMFNTKNKISKPKCKLTGTDGNIFALVGKVFSCLKKNNLSDQAKEMSSKVFKSKSYDDALCIIMEYVEVK